ncbi:Sigma-70, region 4 [Flavobacteriaceae bacterium MAR_2010_188]|nr:Sigma-70, region 4 [Flavobacteriaceae bacterium MAR_2010_188]
MISVITGDIIHSQRFLESNIWIDILKKSFSKLEISEGNWNIYRGDSFQIEIEDVSKALEASVYIKACVMTVKDLNVRMAIGIGEKTFDGENVTESNGTAFVFSGETLENLKAEKFNLKIKSRNKEFDEELNLYFRLSLIAMDNWTTNSAEIVKLYFEHPEKLQKEVAAKLGISQNAVSKRQTRAYLDEILQLNEMYKKKVKAV